MDRLSDLLNPSFPQEGLPRVLGGVICGPLHSFGDRYALGTNTVPCPFLDPSGPVAAVLYRLTLDYEAAALAAPVNPEKFGSWLLRSMPYEVGRCVLEHAFGQKKAHEVYGPLMQQYLSERCPSARELRDLGYQVREEAPASGTGKASPLIFAGTLDGNPVWVSTIEAVRRGLVAAFG
jgi:hypothetical protein